MKKLWIVLIAGVASLAFSGEVAEEDRATDRRAKIDSVAAETLDRLFAEAPQTKKLFKKAHGYAVFSNMKFALGVSGGGGRGVAAPLRPAGRDCRLARAS